MGKRQIVSDSDFGQIVISTRDTAKGISMRPKEDGLYVTAPSCATLKAVMGVVEKYRSRLLDAFSKLLRPRITEGYTIEAECFQLCLKKSPLKHFTMSVEEGGVCIHYPASTDFSSSETQSLLAAAIDGALKKMAMQYLPQRLNFLSKKVGLSFSAVRVSVSRRIWHIAPTRFSRNFKISSKRTEISRMKKLLLTNIPRNRRKTNRRKTKLTMYISNPIHILNFQESNQDILPSCLKRKKRLGCKLLPKQEGPLSILKFSVENMIDK